MSTIELFAGITKDGVDIYSNEIITQEDANIILEYLLSHSSYNRKRKSDAQIAAELADIQAYNDEQQAAYDALPIEFRPAHPNLKILYVDPFSTEPAQTQDAIYNFGREIGENLRSKAQEWKKIKTTQEAIAAAIASIPEIKPVHITDVIEQTANTP